MLTSLSKNSLHLLVKCVIVAEKRAEMCEAAERETQQVVKEKEEEEEVVVIRVVDMTMEGEEGEVEGEGRREGEGEGDGDFSEKIEESDNELKEGEQNSPQRDGEEMELGDSKAGDTDDPSGVHNTVMDGAGNDSSSDGTVGSKLERGRPGSRLRLVLRPLPEDECSDCGLPPSKEESRPSRSADAPKIKSCSGLDCWQIEQPICRLPSPFLNYSQYPSGYCAETLEDCAEIEKMGKLGFNYCEVKGQTTTMRFTDDKGDSATASASLNCALVKNGQTECLRALQEQLRRVEERRKKQKNDVLKRDKEEKKIRGSNKLKPDDSSSNLADSSSDSKPTVEFSASKDSKYSSDYRALEFLPYNPLPTELEHLIFPERSRPLAIYDDPYWPNKANCIKLVESLAGSKSGLSSFTGTYLSPEARGVE